MVEALSVATAIGAIGGLIAIVFDKMRHSRCTKVICCGCCEIDREIEDSAQ
jgi:hypothetical protein